jgi:hypothetical protein
MQPTDLRPILHAQHPRFLPARLEPGSERGQLSGVVRGSVFTRPRQSRPQRGPGRHGHGRAGRPYSPLTTSTSSTRWRFVRRTIGGRGRRQRRLRRVAARASPRFQVPALVEIAAPGRVVPGESGGAAVCGAGAGVAKVTDERLGVRAAAPALLQHRHAWSVPTAEQAKPCLPCPSRGRWRQAGCRRVCDPPCWRRTRQAD